MTSQRKENNICYSVHCKNFTVDGKNGFCSKHNQLTIGNVMGLRAIIGITLTRHAYEENASLLEKKIEQLEVARSLSDKKGEKRLIEKHIFSLERALFCMKRLLEHENSLQRQYRI